MSLFALWFAMFHIIQSNDTDTLVEHLLDFYGDTSGATTLGEMIFSPFTVIVPSMVLGDWLTKQVALRVGISTLFTAEFWGKYQWEMTKSVLEIDARHDPKDALAVPEVAVLSASIMRWRIYGFLANQIKERLPDILQDDQNPLHFLLKPLFDTDTNQLLENRLWQVCDELSRVYVRYLTHRPQWLASWAKGETLTDLVKKMMADKARLESHFSPQQDDKSQDNELPQWLQEYYLSLERLLHFLWQSLFGETYLYRIALENRFWQTLSGKRGQALAEEAKQALPKRLYLFTVQQIPQVELDFLKQLSLYLDVVLFHFNPSKMFWADIVDKNWLLTQRIIKPDSVYLRDYGHGLLSRLGKESRETFAMLADMSGGASDDGSRWHIHWQDEFVSHANKKPTLLNGIKQDILMLGDTDTNAQTEFGLTLLTLLKDSDLEQLPTKSRPKTALHLEESVSSLSIHACHSLKRQLEIARLMIAKYLNEDPSRTLSGVVVLLPDVATTCDLIRAVFPEGEGVDGLTLPIKITGTTDKAIDELMYAIMGFYELLGEPTARFYAEEVYEWLLTPSLFESFYLSFEQMKRGCELLRQAGFKRGFDEAHLAQTLDKDDLDYRYTFSYALDRLVLGLISPAQVANTTLYPFDYKENVFAEAVLPLAGVSLADEPIISALTAIHQGLADNRHEYKRTDTVENLLNHIENQVINRYFAKFHQTVAMRAIFNTKNAMMASLRANKRYHHHLKYGGRIMTTGTSDEVYLSLKFVLNSLASTVKAQALSAEPAEVITFARFGSLRSIPFGLTVMLDMNLSAFPRQDRVGRMDLMKAGVNRRGDRHHEDDDNGAFLDALLCTKDRVLIFYNGVSPDGQTILLPASPVGELLQFLKTEARWQVPNLPSQDDDVIRAVTNALPSLIEGYLTTYHEASAFDKKIFYHTPPVSGEHGNSLQAVIWEQLTKRLATLKLQQKQSLPPPPLWQSVREVLDEVAQKPTPTKRQIVALPSKERLNELAEALQTTLDLSCELSEGQAGAKERLQEHLHHITQSFEVVLFGQEKINTLINTLKNPAKSFLTKKIHLIADEEVDDPDEPLMLTHLQSYQLTELLLKVASFGVFDGMELANLSKDELIKVLMGLTNQPYNHKEQVYIDQLTALYYGNLLPAGALRLQIPSEALQKFGHDIEQFTQLIQKASSDDETLSSAIATLKQHNPQAYSYFITFTEEKTVPIVVAGHEFLLSGDLPVDDTKVWVNLLPNKAKAGHLLAFWTRHLLWQVYCAHQGKTQGVSIWRFHQDSDEIGYKDTTVFAFCAIDYHQAMAWLFNLAIVSQIIKHTPLVMTVKDGLYYAKHKDDEAFVISAESFKTWLMKNDYQSFVGEDNSHHKNWQFILGKQDAFDSLANALPVTHSLFKMMMDNLKTINA